MSPLYTVQEHETSRMANGFWNTLAEFYAARARHETKLITTGGIAPSYLGRWYPKALSLAARDTREGLKTVTAAVHEEGAVILMQILHAGRAACSPISISPSSVKNPVSPYKWSHPVAIPSFAMRYIITEFQRCAMLAVEAGFDGVEIPAVHGTLIHNFLCPLTNRRDDAWGGPTILRRLPFLMQTLDAVRQVVPKDFVVSCRLSVHDLLPEGGNSKEDLLETAHQVVRSGHVNLLCTSVGTPESPVMTVQSHVPRALWAPCVKDLRSYLHQKGFTKVPIVASHRINSPALAEQLLEQGVCDIIGLGRPLLADSAFVQNAKDDNHAATIPCIGCNRCFDDLYRVRRVGCSVNPFSGYELERLPLRPSEFPKTVAVVGGGPAGITCALTLSARGHNVILYEKNREIGGQMNLAKLIPGKEEYFLLLEHWTNELRNSRIRVKLDCEFTREEVSNCDQVLHAVVLTCGGLPRPITSHFLPGAENKKTVSFVDVLTRRVVPGKKVCIVGTGAIAYDVASYLMHDPRVSRDSVAFLKEWGVDLKSATLNLQRQEDPRRNLRDLILFQRANHPPDIGKSREWALKRWLKHHGVTVLNRTMLTKIDDQGLHFCTPMAQTRKDLEEQNFCYDADTIVWCWGMLPYAKPGSGLFEWTRDGALSRGQIAADFGIYMAGQCRETEGMMGQGEMDLRRCVTEGFEVGNKI